MKYSNDCRRLSQLLLTQRDSISLLDSSDSDRLKPYKDLLLDLAILDPSAKEKVLELLKYQHHLDEIPILADWTLPRFPITGGMLAAKGIKQGPMYKLILNQLREAWKRSHYQADEHHLLEVVLPDVIEKTPKDDDSNVAKSKGKNSTQAKKAKP